MLNVFEKDVAKVPQTFAFKLASRAVTLADQDEALKHPAHAYSFAVSVSGADIEACLAAICIDPWYAYLFAINLARVGAGIKTCQKAACKIPAYAYMFARDVKGADIEICQEAACKDQKEAFWFALNVKGANIAYCKKHMTEIDAARWGKYNAKRF